MKNNIFFLFLSLLLLVSCGTDYLETIPATILTTDVAFEKPEGLQGAVYALYDYPRSQFRDWKGCLYFISGTPLIRAEGLLTPDKGLAFYNNSLNYSHEQTKDWWERSYKALNQANVIIGRADGIGFTNDSLKNDLVAQARFFRALALFYLEQRFEYIPLITEEVLTPVNNYRKAKREDIYEVIVNDLLFAIEKLNPVNGVTDGKIARGTAQHLLAKVYLTLEQYSDAAAMATAVIESGDYSLLADRSQLWADGNQNNAEAIYTIQFADNALDGDYGCFLPPMFTPLIDRIDGVKRSFAQGGRPWARYYPSAYLLSLFDSTDKRLEADYKTTWIYDDDGVDDDGIPILPRKIQPQLPKDAAGNPTGDSIEIHLGDTVKWEHVGNELYYGPACKKYWEYGATRPLGNADARKSVIRYRLAETYLIAAEAYWRDGNTEAALPMINKVRERAGVDPFVAADMNEDNILEEYFRELAFENEDWFVLKRMGRLVSMMKEHSPDQNFIEEKHVRMPIPQSFLDATPGYDAESY